MMRPVIAVLSAGGVRSLVAAAAVKSAVEPVTLVLLHARGGHPAGAARFETVRRQAAALDMSDVIDLELATLTPSPQRGRDRRRSPIVSPAAQLHRSRMLVTALAQTALLGAERLVWPAAVDGDFGAVAAVTEQALLAQQLAQSEHPETPAIDTPMLDLTDRQIIELGAQLDVPWEFTFSCGVGPEVPCHACDSCRRRQRAFDSAGIVDPLLVARPA